MPSVPVDVCIYTHKRIGRKDKMLLFVYYFGLRGTISTGWHALRNQHRHMPQSALG
jgi:hypothetical protein